MLCVIEKQAVSLFISILNNIKLCYFTSTGVPQKYYLRLDIHFRYPDVCIAE